MTDIERMYGKRKPIAVRKPLFPLDTNKAYQQKDPSETAAPHEDNPHESTPTATEGETASESELETETETDAQATPKGQPRHVTAAMHGIPRRSSSRPRVSEHDLYHKYFRRDAVLLHNIDLFRYVLNLNDWHLHLRGRPYQVVGQHARPFDFLPRRCILSSGHDPPCDLGNTLCTRVRLVPLPQLWTGPSFTRAKSVQVHRSTLPQELSLPS